MKIPKMRKDTPIFKCVFFSLWLVILVLVGSFYLGHPIFYYNSTFSAPVGLYMMNPFGEIKYNDYLIVRTDKDYGDFKAGSLMLKSVKGFPGYKYVRKKGALELNGKDYFVLEDNRLPQIPEGSYVVPEGTLFLLNDRYNSFDCRYIGPTKVQNIVQKVFLVFNVEEFRKKEHKAHDKLAEYFPVLKKMEKDKEDEK